MTGAPIDAAAPVHRALLPPRSVPLPQDVLLVAVSDHGWRVVDGREPAGSRHRVLAFIELQQDSFEVMQLGAGFECHEFASLPAAVAFVCATTERLESERA